jgi:hypothetical protein
MGSSKSNVAKETNGNLASITANQTNATQKTKILDSAGADLLQDNDSNGLQVTLMDSVGTPIYDPFRSSEFATLRAEFYKQKYGTPVSLAVTNLNSKASSATAGWHSIKVSNLSTVALDYSIGVAIDTANTAPANDKAVYIYVIGWWYDGSSWYASSGGTATLPTDADASYTFASPNNFRLLGVLNYTTADMVMQDTFLLSSIFGSKMPDGFSIFVLNYTGATLAASGNKIYYTPLN